MEKKQLSKAHRELIDAIQKGVKREGINVTYIISDWKTGQLSIGESGDYRMIYEALSVLLCSPLADDVLEKVLPNLSLEALGSIRDMCDDYLDEKSVLRSRNAEKHCKECVRFEEKSHGFGFCPYLENAIDGEEPNKKRAKGGCLHFYGKEGC